MSERTRKFLEEMFMRAQQLGKLILAAGLLASLIACDKSADSYSLLPDQASFQQVSSFAPKKIDVLWVVDNSGSMATSQDNIAANFNSFINRFSQTNYDFNMAIVTTDGWHKMFPANYANSVDERFRDGSGTTHSGIFVMDRNTPNLGPTFTTNVKVGINGDGNERAFESFRQSLISPFNIGKNFRREDAFLAIIIVSDEEDFSNTSRSLIETYTSSGLIPVSTYIDFLDTYTKRLPNTLPNYSVNVISVLDAACQNQLSTDGFARKIGNRYIEIANATGGVKGSLCGDFGNTLSLISDSILELSSSFQIGREPVISSLHIIVDGADVPNDAVNGWTYDASTMTVTFHGSSIPGASSNIQILFDPVTVKE
jgi:hypothetical protein